MSMEEIPQVAPGATRVEYKVLWRSIQDIEAATQISLQSLSTENEGLLRQLNNWFPGKFRAAVGTPLYAHDDTTVLRATHKVS